jgi:hypothetical protein
MKKAAIFLFLTILITGMIFAQPIRDQQVEPDPQPLNERRHDTNPRSDRNNLMSMDVNERRHDINSRFDRNNLVSMDGTLKLERGIVAIESNDSIYFVPLLNRYIGFINELNEGSRISIEGMLYRNIVRPVKITLGDRSYDFPLQRMSQANENHNNNRRWEDNSGRNNHRHGRNHPQNHRNKRCNCCTRR